MSKNPSDHRHDPFNRSRLPGEYDREHCVAMVAEVAAMLLALGGEANTFVGSGLEECLTQGGNLESYLRLRAPRGSHKTAQVLARELSSKT